GPGSGGVDTAIVGPPRRAERQGRLHVHGDRHRRDRSNGDGHVLAHRHRRAAADPAWLPDRTGPEGVLDRRRVQRPTPSGQAAADETRFSGCGGYSLLSAQVKDVNLPEGTQLWVTLASAPWERSRFAGDPERWRPTTWVASGLARRGPRLQRTA